MVGLVGPTASGKSRLAMELALEADVEIISCDSLAVYRGLDVGSAKPTLDDRARVTHHLIDVAEPNESFSAADYARLARAAVDLIQGRGRKPLVVGGTGLYLRAFLGGLFDGPSRDDDLRARLEGLGRDKGIGHLHELLSRVDPLAAERIKPGDRVRIVRALEVYFLTGDGISRRQRDCAGVVSPIAARLIGLCPPRGLLRQAVELRTREMFRHGLVAELEALLARGLDRTVRPLQAIGYKQALAVLDGRLTPSEAEAEVVRETMRLAKRQMTWFRHQADVEWFEEPVAAALALRSVLTSAS